MQCTNASSDFIISIILLSSFILCIPLCLWSVYRIYKSIQKADAFMMARKPILSFTLLCLNLFDIVIIQPLYCVLFAIHGITFYLTLIPMLTDIRFIIFGLFFVSRMYILHFDYEYCRECVNLLWHRNNKENFYLKHRNTYGNTRNVIKITLILCLLYILILSLPYLIAIDALKNNTLYINISLFSLEALLLFIFYCKINGIDDKFGIKKEILCITLCPSLCAFCYYLIFVILRDTITITISQQSECNTYFIYSFSMLFIMSTTVMIKTVIPLRLILKQNEEHKHTMRLMSVGDKNNREVCFEDVLGSRTALFLFVEHVESEFSLENLLFLIETAKFRDYYLSKIVTKPEYELLLKQKPKKIDTDTKYSLLIDYEMLRTYIENDFDLEINIQHFVEPLTASFIPTPMEYNESTVQEAAVNIFEHFVDDGSMHMINISYQCRSKIKQLMETQFEYEALSTIFIFDDAFNEIYSTILADTFLRFKFSKKFTKFLKEGRLENVVGNDSDGPCRESFTSSYSELHLALQRNKTPTPQTPIPLTTIESGLPTDTHTFPNVKV
eukprot:265002_1